MTEEHEKPTWYVIIYRLSNGSYCVHLARDAEGKHEIVSRPELPAAVESAIQAAEEETAY